MAVPRAAGAASPTAFGPITTSPALARSWPPIIRSVVVLPQPEGPSRQQ